MPPKVQSASSKGQTSLFSFFNKPPAAVAVVEAEPATTPAKSETLVKRSNEESSSTEKQDVKKLEDPSDETIKKRKTVIYDEEEDEEVKIKPTKKSSARASKAIVDDEDEWDDAASMKSESVASDSGDSFVVDESEESDDSSDDELVNSDSEEEASKKKKKTSRTSKPPLPPKSRSAPSTATKASRAFDDSLAVTPKNKSQDGKRVLIPFEGSGSASKSTPGSGLSAFKQSNHALISPRSSQTASPFFGGTAATPGSQSTAGSPGSTAFASPSPTQHLNLPEGVVGRGSHEHNFFPFLLPENRKDANGVRMGYPEFSSRTLQVPPKFMQEQTPAMCQWWQFKAQNMDTVLFFKVGKFYELFHMDADIGFAELDLIYMKGTKAHSGFPEVSYGKFASILVSKGYRVARVEQTETPDMLKERNDATRGKKDKVVARELCSVMSKGTRTYCHLDDLSLLESEDPDRLSSSVLVCIKEALFSPAPPSAAPDSSMEVDSAPTPVSAADALPEYGVCVVDTVLCTITLAQFQDDKQRSRLRTLLARYRPSEVLLETDQHSPHTQGVVQLLAPKAVVEMLSAGGEMMSAADTVKIILKSQYFGSGKKSLEGSAAAESLLRGWPAVLKAVHAGLEDGTSELVLSALGGALWQLRRSLIDYEVLSMGKVYGYIPPDEQTATAASASGDLTQQAVPRPSQCLFTQQDVENHQITFDMQSPDEQDSAVAVDCPEPAAAEVEEEGDIKTMTLDEVALTNLEILVNNYDRTEKGSLWAFVNRTKTSFGRRLLRSWLCHPLYRCKDIARRQAAVAELLGPLSEAAEAARAAMRGMPDLERLLTRVHSNGLRKRGPIEHPDARAILYENYNVRKIKDFADVLGGFEMVVKVGALFEKLSLSCPLLKLALGTPQQGGKFPRQEIRELLAHFREIFDEKQAKKEGNIRPRPGIDSDFDDAKEDIARIESEFEQYLRQMKKETGISDLKYFGSNKDRYQIEVPMALSNRVPAQWTSKSQKKTHRRYWTATVEELLGQLTAAEDRLAVAQKDTLRRVFEKFDASFAVWSSAISCVALLDALLALATVSSFPGYVRPAVRPTRLEDGHTPELSIVGGRHPMLEFSLLQRGEGDCIPNDLQLGGVIAQPLAQYHPRMLLLSGPNMGGKSTLLRQTCLITVLAQVGCWVPATSCTMTPVDRIFTRVGASDRILAGQSTFFVELAETATILSAATKNSLCILDELGRGTATFDGTAIAHAVVEHLVSSKHCRSLFATHYHSLVTDWELDPRVRLGHMDCLVQGAGEGEEEKTSMTTEEVTFLYKLSEGSSPRSYGINVARLAGLPDAVIELALRQSRAFEDRMQSAHAAAAVVAQSGVSAAGCGSLSHDQVAAVYERLASLARSTSPLPELAFVARELWCRLRSMVASSTSK